MLTRQYATVWMMWIIRLVCCFYWLTVNYKHAPACLHAYRTWHFVQFKVITWSGVAHAHAENCAGAAVYPLLWLRAWCYSCILACLLPPFLSHVHAGCQFLSCGTEACLLTGMSILLLLVCRFGDVEWPAALTIEHTCMKESIWSKQNTLTSWWSSADYLVPNVITLS